MAVPGLRGTGNLPAEQRKGDYRRAKPMIRKEGGGYRLHSKTTGKPLGPVRRSAEEVADKDEKRVQFFRNLKKSKGGKGSLRAKVKKKSLLKAY